VGSVARAVGGEWCVCSGVEGAQCCIPRSRMTRRVWPVMPMQRSVVYHVWCVCWIVMRRSVVSTSDALHKQRSSRACMRWQSVVRAQWKRIVQAVSGEQSVVVPISGRVYAAAGTARTYACAFLQWAARRPQQLRASCRYSLAGGEAEAHGSVGSGVRGEW